MAFLRNEENLILMPAEVHIWSASFSEAENDAAYFLSLLSKDERERAKAFRFSKDKTRFIISRGILRSLLAKYLGEMPHNLEILYGLWGKPCLPPDKSLHFNLSHSENYVLYALTRNYEVGIDLEYINKDIDFEDIVKNIFSTSELKYWVELNPKEKLYFFFRFWVCKEAFLKATGKGWLETERKMIFKKSNIFGKNSRESNLKERAMYPYFFECIPGYASALFVEGPPLHLLHYIWKKDIFK